jgi:predicted HicB family RNase H-like nuclease
MTTQNQDTTLPLTEPTKESTVPPPAQDVSTKNTKAEILEAYENLVHQYESNVHTRKAEKAARARDDNTVANTRAYTSENILKHIEEVKLVIGNTLNELGQQLTREAQKFTEIQEAINIQTKRLKELYDIEGGATELSDLIRAQETKKELFEAEYRRMQSERSREEEEYKYDREQKRKRDAIDNEERENAWRKREDVIKTNEQELVELRNKIAALPSEREKVVQSTREETEKAIRAEMQIKIDIAAQEYTGERKVFETRIAFLEKSATRQSTEIESLKKELEESGRQVRSIAEKAIESTSGKQTLKAVSDIAMQQAGRHSVEEYTVYLINSSDQNLPNTCLRFEFL